MTIRHLVHDGTVTTAGFVVDVGAVGEAEARRRVLALYRPGTVVSRIDDGRWLVELAMPVEAHSRRSPGLPVVRHDERLVGSPDAALVAAADQHDPSGFLTLVEGGVVVTHRRSDLVVIDVAEWIDVSDLSVTSLTAMDRPPTPVEVLAPVRPPDLRKRAGLGAPSEKAEAFAAAVRGAGNASATSSRRGRRVAGGSAGAARPRRVESAISKALLRSPAARAIGHQHARYLDDLTRRFTTGDLDEALRRAIPVGGLGAGGVSLRLPSRRNSISVSDVSRATSSSVPLGPTIDAHLRTIYAEAGAALERQGRVDEAAFVFADLLNQPLEAVAVFERAGRWKEAAALADGRKLAPAMVVRLWFRAGDRYRALNVARRHGVFAAAIQRLGDDDPDLARGLREDWVASCLAAGDVLGAVEAAWPEPSLRSRLDGPIDLAIATGGPAAAGLRAYRLASRPSPAHRSDVLEFLDPDAPGAGIGAGIGGVPSDGIGTGSRGADRRRFALTLAELTVDDPSLDREVCTATVRSVVAEPRGSVSAEKIVDLAMKRLRDRADSVLVADLPVGTVPAVRADPPRGGIIHPLPPSSGVTLCDAAVLPHGEVLVALGEGGAALLRADGRVAARWDVPTDSVVVADHGLRALLTCRRGESTDVTTLDIASRTARHWGVVRIDAATATFDGAGWIVVDKAGLAVLDTTAERPIVAWRELEPGWVLLDLQRTASSLGAIIDVTSGRRSGERKVERWSWRLPSMHLSVRTGVTANDVGLGATVTSTGDLYALHLQADGLALRGSTGFVRYPAEGNPRLLYCATAAAVAVGDDDLVQRLDLWTDLTAAAASIQFDGATGVRVRGDGEHLVVNDDAGRVIVVDPRRLVLQAEFRVRW